MEGDGDIASIIAATKCNERRMTMLGGNAPSGHIIRMVTEAAAPRGTSTDRIAEVIERLCAEGQAAAEPDESGKPN